jgi:hypothetical protein
MRHFLREPLAVLPLLVDPPDSLECQLRAVVFGGVVDHTTMTPG